MLLCYLKGNSWLNVSNSHFSLNQSLRRHTKYQVTCNQNKVYCVTSSLDAIYSTMTIRTLHCKTLLLSIALDLLAVIKTKRVSTSLWSYNGTTDCYSIYAPIKQNKEGSLQNLIVEVYKAPPPLGM